MDIRQIPMRQRKQTKLLCFGAGLAAGLVTGMTVAQRYRRSLQSISEAEMPHGQAIVILGAGFSGIHVAEELAELLPLKNENKIIPLRHLSFRVQFQQGQVDAIDLAARTVTITVGDSGDGVPKSSHVLQADQLIIALGSVTNFHGVSGVQQHSLTIKTLDNAAAICNRALALLERASAEPNEAERRAALPQLASCGHPGGADSSREAIAARTHGTACLLCTA